VVTDLPGAVGGAQALRLVLLIPRLEEVFKDGRLSALAHHLHIGAGRVVLSLDEALGARRGYLF